MEKEDLINGIRDQEISISAVLDDLTPTSFKEFINRIMVGCVRMSPKTAFVLEIEKQTIADLLSILRMKISEEPMPAIVLWKRVLAEIEAVRSQIVAGLEGATEQISAAIHNEASSAFIKIHKQAIVDLLAPLDDEVAELGMEIDDLELSCCIDAQIGSDDVWGTA